MMVGREPTEEDLDLSDRITETADIIVSSLLNVETPKRWNSMRDMRTALGLPMGNDVIPEFLEWWERSLNASQRAQFRRDDLNNIAEWDFPRPTTANKEIQ